jgi:hypothetical protein
MSIQGFNAGYNLSYYPLAWVPAPNAQVLQENAQLYSPQLTSFQPQLAHPAGNDAPMAAQTADAYGRGAYHYGNAAFPSGFNAPRSSASARGCKNAIGAAMAGAAQCMDSQGYCHPPVNNTCPPDSTMLNQFTGAVRKPNPTSAGSSYSPAFSTNPYGGGGYL